MIKEEHIAFLYKLRVKARKLEVPQRRSDLQLAEEFNLEPQEAMNIYCDWCDNYRDN
tara:strand:+ start:24560 stop:24730 length:171 start_codon:yes stop_codon:yes gene_type:complete